MFSKVIIKLENIFENETFNLKIFLKLKILNQRIGLKKKKIF